ncbi:Malonyl CoA-acyl carrier protein transacylase [Actinosynnema pretiosum subsp. pretiosum]|nr:Malonyl CoA-acyl carrier protein transacylase [Actinosynnema pretiosum subsp. pretiosum]
MPPPGRRRRCGRRRCGPDARRCPGRGRRRPGGRRGLAGVGGVARRAARPGGGVARARRRARRPHPRGRRLLPGHHPHPLPAPGRRRRQEPGGAAVRAGRAAGRPARARRRARRARRPGGRCAGLRDLAPHRPGGAVLVFPGQGAQWPGMAVALRAESRAFAAALDDCADAIQPHVDWSVADVLRAAPGSAALDRVDVVQPALFAVMVSLAALWRDSGVRVDAVIGHSQGEIAAAVVAGALSLADGAAVVALRSRAIAGMAGSGGMLSVPLPARRVRADLADLAGAVGVAAVNGPASTVVSGDADALRSLLARYTADGVDARTVPVDYASHSAHVEVLRERLLTELAGVSPRACGTPFYSTLTGDLLDTTALTADYWYRNLRGTVELDRAVRAALRDGARAFVESSAHPVLAHGIGQTVDDTGSTALVTGTLRREQGGSDQFLRSLARVHVRGGVDWADFHRSTGARAVDLPGYAFQGERHRLGGDALPAVTAPSGASARDEAAPTTDQPPVDVTAAVRASAAAVLGLPSPDAVPLDRTFKQLGLDSAGAVEFRDLLAATLGRRLPVSLTYDHPTPERVVGSLTGTTTTGTTTRAGHARGDDREPIAVVAMSGRWPGGADSPEALWRLAADGVDAISPFPDNRGWDLARLHDPDGRRPNTSRTREGGFLHDADLFDAAFFGLSPREAAAMDPQQRLLLESAWELFERAGLDPTGLRGSRTGVFVGMMPPEYGRRMHRTPGGHEGHALTGSATSVASGRLAYVFGLEGPALTVDTACSASLVSLHLAVRSLRSGESAMAVAGGVAVMSAPGMFTEFSKQGGLAPDGRCKPFSAAADGTAWAEGVGLLLLQRLSDARRDGNPVLAVVRGSAVNSDGASNGLTAPNGPAQERVIRAALADAGLAPEDVDAVQAHGTGTALGDPIEARALINTYGDRPEGRPLLLGSVKSNIGHTQAAAGVTGVIVAVQALRAGLAPGTLHLTGPTPHVDWSAGSVLVPAATTPWPEVDRPRRAGVSSFGISGTNAHVIVEQHVEPAAQPPVTQPPVTQPPDEGGAGRSGAGEGGATSPDPGGLTALLPWVLSGRDPAAVRAQAAALADHVAARPDLRDADVALALATTRARWDHRASVVGADRAELLTGLRALADGGAGVTEASGAAPLVHLFSGQGAQRAGMGERLHRAHPVFARAWDDAVDAIDAVDAESAGRPATPVREVLWSGGDLVHRTDYAQAGLFVLQTALFRLFESWGLRPELLIGHSVGEIAAAHVAGVLDLPDAARLVAARGRLMAQLPQGGAMIAVEATGDELAEAVHGEPLLSVAAVNGPRSCVLSGAADRAEAVAERFTRFGRRVKRLRVSHAFHSPLVEPVLDRFREVLADLRYAPPGLAAVSTVTGGPVRDEWSDPEYWARHVVATVRFHQAVSGLPGAPAFLEIGPDGVLTAQVDAILDGARPAVPALRAGQDEERAVAGALGALHAAGRSPDWAAVRGPGWRPVDLPTTVFARKRFWLADVDAPGGDDHPLLPGVVRLADGGLVLTGAVSLGAAPWLADHVVLDRVLLPGTAFAELALRAADVAGGCEVGELTLHTPLPLDRGVTTELQVALSPPDDTGRRELRAHSRTGDGEWTGHGSGHLAPARPAAQPTAPAPGGQWPPPGARPVDLVALRAALPEGGYHYGPAFQGLVALWSRDDDLFAELSAPERDDGYGLHPALLDAALHPLVAAGLAEDATARLPFAWSGVRLHRRGATALRAHLVRGGAGGAATTVTITATDEHGDPVLTVDELRLLPVKTTGARPAVPHVLRWLPAAPGAAPGRVTTVDLAESGPDEVTAGARAGRVVLDARGLAGGDPVVGAHRAVAAVTDALRRWLALDPPPAEPLVVLTGSASAAAPGDDPDLATAALAGLLRSAQAEHPGRLALLDVDGHPDSAAALPAALGAAEPELALRRGALLAPRLARRTGGTHTPSPPTPTAPSWSPAAPARSARWSPATWSPSTASATCCSPAAGARTRPARPSWWPS